MAQPINRYKADLRDHNFLLFEQFKIQDLLGKPPFAEWGEDEVRLVLDEVYRFSTDVTGPLNGVGDGQGCTLVDGQVHVPEGFADAWKKLYEAGWKSLSVPAEFGGQGAPRALSCLTEEFMSGANPAFNMYPGLTLGAAEVIAEFGTPRQKELFAQRMFSGQWGGTMCLTEPHAGSDVGSASSTARPIGDGLYKIKGTKIFISGGDQDICENIVHLVLARIDGAVAGTKGLSLFIVPKHRVNEDGTLGAFNDVVTASIEHKMGINGSATAALQFGDDDECIGEVVGNVEHQGMRQMFLMMNYARVGTGIQGLGVAGSAYLNALEYAKDRKQGSSVKNWKDPNAPRAAIIEHPNVRRMLLDMKARVEGLRALITKIGVHWDRAAALKGKDDDAAMYHQGQIDLLTPIVKAFTTDQAFFVCEKAVQVYGGAGYLKDWPVEQYARDAKIFQIYEGTNAIQSLDLVGRKLGQGGGKNAQDFLGDIQKFIDKNREHPVLGASVGHLQKAHEAVASSAMQFMMWFQAGQMELIPLSSERFLEMMGELTIAWLLLEGAAIALEKIDGATGADKAFYEGKKAAALFFANNVLPTMPARAQLLAASDRTAVELSDEAFANI